MTTAVIAALSLQAKAEQYGAYAGIAAIFGLGVLSLLYFAQAREVKRLREWAGRAPERAAEAEARVIAQADERRTGEPGPEPAAVPAPAAANGSAAPQPAPAPVPVVPVAGMPASSTEHPGRAPGVPASVPTTATAAVTAAGARAAAATVSPAPLAGIPASSGGAPPPPPPMPAPAPVPTPAAVAGTATAAKPAPAPAPSPAPEPAPAGGATNGGGSGAPPPLRPAPAPATPAVAAAGAGDGSSRTRPPLRTAAAPLRGPGQSVAPRTAASVRSRARGAGGRSRRTLLTAGAAMAAMVAIVVVLGITLTGGDDPTPAPKPNTVAPPAAANPSGGGTETGSTNATAPRVNRGDVTVAVLNGTTVTGLARGASDKLTKAGFKPGVVTNDTTNQARSATAVLYTEGNRRAALDAARIVRVGRDAVQPIDQGTRLLAGEDADVVVSVGADQSQ